jgi:polysaccharide biosynthesis/export protein
MQPARLGAARMCVASALLGLLVLAPPTRAQAVLETPQQANDRIRELSAAARVEPRDYIIGNGDLLDIEIFDVKELSRDVRVSQTGTISIPLVPVRLHVSGLTEMQAEQKISEVLAANGLVSHADVTITIRERKSKPITVVGAVSHPLVYQADRQITLLEVLAEAGGLANDAGNDVIVTRPVPEMTFTESDAPANGSADAAAPKSKPLQAEAKPSSPAPSASTGNTASTEPPELSAPAQEKSTDGLPGPSSSPSSDLITVNLFELMEAGNTKNNILLQAGDIVTVPHAGIVYVLGAVGRPGGFVLTNDRERISALKILALAGGFTNVAKTDHAVIIRKDAQGKQQEVALDLKKILNRQAEDLQLEPSDILYVPSSAAKQALLRSLELGIALGSAVALYRIAYH